jgi:septum site-determining protein MinC
MANSVTFKGVREGLIITLGEGDWRDLVNELSAQLARPQAQSFFRGARVLLETGHRAIEVEQLEELIALLSQSNMQLISVLGERSTQEAFDQIRTAAKPPEILPAEEPLTTEVTQDSPTAGPGGLVIHRTVRSGQYFHHAGSIVVIGDVNPGAEVVAGGDVIVWGKLRGVVHAGAPQNNQAFVGALLLAPTQLRIGEHIARAPEEKNARHAVAEIARVRGGAIIVEPWYE